MQTIGGQAIIEGVMLRNKTHYTMAVRDPKGKISVEKIKIIDHRKGLLSLFKLPFFRGMYAMVEMLTIGMKTLIKSSFIAHPEEAKDISKKDIVLLILTSLLLSLTFFVVLPYILTTVLGIEEITRPVLFNVVDAVIKIIFFIGYVYAISRMEEVRRLFQYHGAEHKIVMCAEKEKTVTIKKAKKYSRLHPRCGTSFIVLVAVISILFFSVLPLFFNTSLAFESLSFFGQKGILFALRLLCIPLIAGFSYEVLRLAGMYQNNILFKIVSAPGLALQLLTTAEPDAKQLEVAHAALKPLLK